MEIERQWLLKKEKIPYALSKLKKKDMTQCYLNFDPEIRIRSFNNGKRCVLTVKAWADGDGLIRAEVEKKITKEEYAELFAFKKGYSIEKTRYIVPDERYEGKYIQEIDIFHGILDGFCVLEVEFESREEAEEYTPPDWAETEVTSDFHYKNVYIAGSDEAEIKRLIHY